MYIYFNSENWEFHALPHIEESILIMARFGCAKALPEPNISLARKVCMCVCIYIYISCTAIIIIRSTSFFSLNLILLIFSVVT